MSDNSGVAFARKYRPRTADEYMGEHIRKILENRFSDVKNFPQTILLHGTRGCGKTSFARLLSKEYHCMNRVDGHACGKCEMCQEIDNNLINSEAGVTALGVQEVDIASDSGKANIEEILEEAMQEPIYPLVYKVLILDEFHMATRQAQNRLLKILEEPPKHLIFILCTTNPENILDTILSRCQLKIEVKKANIDELANRLLYVCKQENIKTSMEALRVIAKKADRVPREALMLLESIAKNYNYVVNIENVQKQTGDVASEIYIEYIRAANLSLEAIMQFNRKLKDLDITYKKFMSGLTQFVLDSLYIKYAIGIEDYPVEYVKAIKSLFKTYNSEEFDMLLQIVEYAIKMIDSDDTKAELVVTTTAMRIGKVGLMAVGLAGQDLEAVKENKASMLAYRGLIKADADKSKEVNVETADDSMLATIFGKNAQGVTVGKNIIVNDSEKEPSIQEEDNRTLSDEELLKMFNC